MKRAWLGLALGLAASCGGSDSSSSSGTKNLGNFLGATTWSGSTNTTVSCPGSPAQSSTNSFAVAFSAGSGADLQYTSQANCTFKFNVSGNTGSLSNGPVTCSATSSGITINFSWTSYTATTSDGHNLTVNSAGTASASGQTCPFTITGSATR
jgi:hypothetical protein